MAVVRRLRAARRRRREEGRAGFTLLEVVIALGVLTFGLLGVAAMQLYSLRQGQVGKHTTQASILAQDQVENLMRSTFTALVPTGGWQNVTTVTNSIVTNSGTREDVAFSVDQRISNVTVGFTKSVDVRVTWADQDDPNRALVISTLRYDY
ncbi:MAG: prepilin-type N-terminal cleavage/methylation domain-containing protein [Deltaproteobacteria bacterium]|nr:prepilin-type N-terminal cleavage/methylation domain-containing protein [Deltaproteobacteria bacterium]